MHTHRDVTRHELLLAVPLDDAGLAHAALPARRDLDPDQVPLRVRGLLPARAVPAPLLFRRHFLAVTKTPRAAVLYSTCNTYYSVASTVQYSSYRMYGYCAPTLRRLECTFRLLPRGLRRRRVRILFRQRLLV